MLGIAVLVVAFLALRNPKHNAAAGASQTVTTTRTVPAPSTPLSTVGPSDSSAPSGSSASTGASDSVGPSDTSGASSSHGSAVGSQPLVVLNAVGTPNLATEAATQFEQAGWTVSSVADYTNNFLSTAAYYDPAVPGARRAAHALQRQFPFIKRVVERFPQLPAGPVVVVLWSDYTG